MADGRFAVPGFGQRRGERRIKEDRIVPKPPSPFGSSGDSTLDHTAGFEEHATAAWRPRRSSRAGRPARQGPPRRQTAPGCRACSSPEAPRKCARISVDTTRPRRRTAQIPLPELHRAHRFPAPNPPRQSAFQSPRRNKELSRGHFRRTCGRFLPGLRRSKNRRVSGFRTVRP